MLLALQANLLLSRPLQAISTSWLCDTVELINGAWMTSAYPGLGIAGGAVPSSGTDGPSALYACVTLPADANVEVRGEVTRWPVNGTLQANEDWSFVYIGSTDYCEFKLYADGVASTVDVGFGPGIVRVWFYVGGSGSFAGAVQLDNAAPGGGFVGSSVVFVRAPDEYPEWTFTFRAIR